MDKKEYDNGYKAAVEQLRKAIEGQQNNNSNNGGSDNGLQSPAGGSSGGSGSNRQKSVDNKGTDGKPMGSVEDAINNGPEANKRKAQKNAAKGQQGQGGGSQGQMSGNSSRDAADSDVGATGGGMIDQRTAIEITKRAGYDDADDVKKNSNVSGDWKNAVQDAIKKSRNGAPGTNMGNTLIAISNLYKTSTNWKTLLKKYMGTALSRVQSDQKWGKKRDLAAFDEISPYNRAGAGALSDVIFAIDASGSTSGEMFRRILSECYSIAYTKGIRTIDILPFDTEVREHFKLHNRREIPKMKFKGGGGTNVVPVFEYLDKNLKKAVELVVIFSDGGFYDIPKRISKMKNVLWVIYNNPTFAEDFERSGAKDSKTKLVCIQDDNI